MRRVHLIAITAALSLVVAGVAIAAHNARDGETKKVSAEFTASEKRVVRERTCDGTDGDYHRVVTVYEGTSSSSESQLRGKLRARVYRVYKEGGPGRIWGRVRIYDDETRRLTARAWFRGITDGNAFQGWLHGRSRGQGPLFAVIHGTVDGTFSAQIGAGSLASHAIVKGGHCVRDTHRERDD